ncbi:unnamed protein product [Nippostrongylus brasiliensis]|uniref:Large ribosomal subunit protein mL43 n=1 Tax=Nippostrongylus brasiliensis TaxID=27835 RepID=A0A158R1I3_NIPBR|nr:unnamed protein product [Nippostrongylus brasiliensis]
MPALPRVDRIKTVYSSAKALNFGWKFTDFLKTPAYNGVSRYVPQLHRITFRFCKQSEASVGVRNFIENRVLDLGAKSPSVVIYTQPVRNTNPVIRAEYGNGRVVQLNAKNMSMEDVERDGEWTPMTWLSPRMNSASLPAPEFSKHKTAKITASEYLMEQQKRLEEIINYWKALPHRLLKDYPEQTIMYATFGLATVVMAAYKLNKYGITEQKPYYRGYYDVVRSDDPLAKSWRKPEEYPAPYLSSGVEYAC